MKYIDADQLKAEVERFSATEYGDNTWGDDVANGALDYVLEEIIPSLRQEQPKDLEEAAEKYADSMGLRGFDKVRTISDFKAGAEWKELSEADLEKEIDDYIKGCLGSLTGLEIASCARYFYELGCRRTAEMYDDIEYNRQMAEEKQTVEGIDEEIDRLWESFSEEMSGPHNLFDVYRRLAHHFAEWGAEHLKRSE